MPAASLLAALKDAERLVVTSLLGKWPPKKRKERWLAVCGRLRLCRLHAVCACTRGNGVGRIATVCTPSSKEYPV
jgi:hypothetical protein